MFSGIGGFEGGIELAYGQRTFGQSNMHEHSPDLIVGGEHRRASGGNGAKNAAGNYSATARQQSGFLPGNGNDADAQQIRFGTQQPHCVGFSEIDRNAIGIYRYHYDHFNYGDATAIDPAALPDFDLLVGGFPCQAFSIAGKRAGFTDTRGTLFFEITRILAAKKPAHFLLENVKGLFSHDEGRTFKTIVAALIDLGYCVEWDCLNSKFYGVPQNRERVFIVGHLGRLPGREIFPVEESNGGNSETVRAERSLRGRNKNTSGCLDTRGVNAFDRADLDKLVYMDQVNQSKKSGGKQPYQQNRVYSENGIAPAHQANLSSGSYAVETARTNRSGGRRSPHGSKSNWDSYEVDSRIRRLTPLECERLQGFSDGWTKYGLFFERPTRADLLWREKNPELWAYGTKAVNSADVVMREISDSGRYKALGNAVTVPVISTIIGKMMVCCDS
jgi:DNA (cytosine-5)-methyltransferase 1